MNSEPSIPIDELEIEEVGGVRTSFWSPKRIVLVQILAFTVVIVMLETGFGPNRYVGPVLTVVNVIGWGIGMLAWCKADARERGYKLHDKFPLAVVFFGTGTLIYYLFRSRGFARGLAGVGLFVLFLAAMYLIVAVFAIIVLIVKILVFHQPIAPPPPRST